LGHLCVEGRKASNGEHEKTPESVVFSRLVDWEGKKRKGGAEIPSREKKKNGVKGTPTRRPQLWGDHGMNGRKHRGGNRKKGGNSSPANGTGDIPR